MQRVMVPDGAVAFVLPRLIGMARTKDFLLRGHDIDAPRAWRSDSSLTPLPRTSFFLTPAIAQEFACLPTAVHRVAAGIGLTLVCRSRIRVCWREVRTRFTTMFAPSPECERQRSGWRTVGAPGIPVTRVATPQDLIDELPLEEHPVVG